MKIKLALYLIFIVEDVTAMAPVTLAMLFRNLRSVLFWKVNWEVSTPKAPISTIAKLVSKYWPCDDYHDITPISYNIIISLAS